MNICIILHAVFNSLQFIPRGGHAGDILFPEPSPNAEDSCHSPEILAKGRELGEVAGKGGGTQVPKRRPHSCYSKGVSGVLWLI